MEQEQVAEKEEAVEVEVADPSIKEQKEQRTREKVKNTMVFTGFPDFSYSSFISWSGILIYLFEE